jgi:hypothetical protein
MFGSKRGRVSESRKDYLYSVSSLPAHDASSCCGRWR